MPSRLLPALSAVLALACTPAVHGPTTAPPTVAVAPPEGPPPSAAITPPAALDARVSGELLRADLRRLEQLLVDSHPDAFSGGGGRVAFARRFAEVAASIGDDGMTVAEFLARVRPLVAAVRDGHTTIGSPLTRDDGPRARLELSIAGGEIYVSGVPAPADRHWLGARVSGVGGVGIAELAARMQTLRGYDNAYTNLVHLRDALVRPDGLAALLRSEAPATTLALELSPAHGPAASWKVPFASATPAMLRPPTHYEAPELDDAGMGWAFVDGSKSIAVLRIASMMRYREAFEVWRATGFTANLGDHLTAVAKAAAPYDRPRNVDEAIALVPSATATMTALMSEMAEHHTQVLIVDLRGNTGGNSAMNAIVGYFLMPVNELVSLDEGYQIPRYSQLWLDNHDATLDELRGRIPGIELGDFDFSEERRWRAHHRAVDHDAPPVDDVQARIDAFIAQADAIPTFAAELRERRWSAGFTGPVVVVGDADTYSAGFDLLAMLVRRGATFVGTPSSQAGNCFIDALGYELPASGLRGSISYKRSLMFPDDPARGELLRPDVELTWRELAAHHFDPEAAMQLAIAAARTRARHGRARRP